MLYNSYKGYLEKAWYMLDKDTTVVVATGNAHKLVEIEAILSNVLVGYKFVSIKEVGDFEDPIEDGETFYENACIKAKDALAKTGFKYAIADDSGLEVDALNGAPGIYSARFAGVHGDDLANNNKLLEELDGVEKKERRAAFHSCVVLASDDGDILFGDGYCEGYIGFEPQGDGGFGYDPLFYPDATPVKTMAQLTSEEKNAISHRFYALQELSKKIEN